MRFGFDFLFRQDNPSPHNTVPLSGSGFKRLGNPSPSLSASMDASVRLVSRENIYSDGENGTLLLKKGTEILPDALPKLVQCGADPSLFYIKANPQPGNSYDTNNPVLRDARAAIFATKRVLVLDSNPKGLTRMMNQLVSLGFSMGKIHPVRMPQYLGWSIEKYQPDLLILDYQLSGSLNALDVLKSATECANVPQVIMTVPTGVVTKFNQENFFAQVDALQVDVLFKPVPLTALEGIVL